MTGRAAAPQAARPEAPEEPAAPIEEPVEPSEPPDEGRLAEIEYMRLTASRGWMQDRRESVLRDFVRRTGQYPALVKFARSLR